MILRKFIYPDLDVVMQKHDEEVILKSGGTLGILDAGLIDSALSFIENDRYYKTFEDKLTHLVFSIAKNHAFVDGNKRTAIVVGAYFLEVNSYDQYVIDVFIREMENVILLVVQNRLNKRELKEIISDYIKYTELRPETALIYVKKLKELE